MAVAMPDPKPFVSALINADASHGHRSFGYSWQEVVRSVAGFCVEAQTDGIRSIQNLTEQDVEDPGSLVETKGIHYLILLHGEFLKQLDVVADQAGVVALRFATNLRSMPWLGCGGKPTTTSFIAPDGYCIKLLKGSIGKRWCAQLRVVYSPIEQEKPDKDPGGEVTLARLGEEASRIRDVEFCRSLRAIAATCSGALGKLDVLSESEFAFLITASECVRLNPDEHFFALVEASVSRRLLRIAMAPTELVSASKPTYASLSGMAARVPKTAPFGPRASCNRRDHSRAVSAT